MPSVPRGLRLNNAGNIEHGADWKGLGERVDERFCSFVSPEYGVRAIYRILRTYHRKYSIDTIHGIIYRWAPPCENPTDVYVKNVSNWADYPATKTIDINDYELMARIVYGIIRQEQGYCPFDLDFIERSIQL